jgi:hypothetical protein
MRAFSRDYPTSLWTGLGPSQGIVGLPDNHTTGLPLPAAGSGTPIVSWALYRYAPGPLCPWAGRRRERIPRPHPYPLNGFVPKEIHP